MSRPICRAATSPIATRASTAPRRSTSPPRSRRCWHRGRRRAAPPPLTLRPPEAAVRIAYQGLPGAFGHQAALAFAPGYEPVAEPSFAAVVAAVAEGRAERGILPVENNEAGPVAEAQALLAGGAVAVIGEEVLPIRMHLLGLPGARLEDIRTVVSHPVALR